MFPSSDYRYRRSVDVRFGCRNDGFGGDNYIFNKGEEGAEKTNLFTEFQREKVIKFYIKYGLKAGPVIRKFGYPCRSVLSD